MIDMEKCSVCGLYLGEYRLKLSSNFVGYSDLYDGDKVCRTCYTLLSDQKYRRSNWIVVGDEVKILDKNELMKIIKEPPVNSLIYVKSRGRRLTFIKCLRFRSTRNNIVLCHEEYGPLFVDRDKLEVFLDLAVEAYSVFKKKKTLLEGCSPRDWVHEDLCLSIEEVRGDPLWAVIVSIL